MIKVLIQLLLCIAVSLCVTGNAKAFNGCDKNMMKFSQVLFSENIFVEDFPVAEQFSVLGFYGQVPASTRLESLASGINLSGVYLPVFAQRKICFSGSHDFEICKRDNARSFPKVTDNKTTSCGLFHVGDIGKYNFGAYKNVRSFGFLESIYTIFGRINGVAEAKSLPNNSSLQSS